MKDIEKMTVEELVNSPQAKDLAFTFTWVILPIFNELIRRAKLAEQPKWRLTQILQELEQAGLEQPETLSVDYCSDVYDCMPISVFYTKDTELDNLICLSRETDSSNWFITISDHRGIKHHKRDSYNTLPEAIEKLKELLK